MENKEKLGSMLDAIIGGNKEQAAVDFSQYLTAKIRELRASASANAGTSTTATTQHTNQ